MLVRQSTMQFVKDNLALFSSDRTCFEYRQAGLPETLEAFFEGPGADLDGDVYIVWQQAKPVGWVITMCGRGAFYGRSVLYIGVTSSRALAELFCSIQRHDLVTFLFTDEEYLRVKEALPKGFYWNEQPRRVNPFSIEEDKPLEEDGLKPYTLQGKPQTPRLLIRHTFYDGKCYLKPSNEDVFYGFARQKANFLTRYRNVIESVYYELQSERFALMGDAWQLNLVKTRSQYVENEAGMEEVKQRWIEETGRTYVSASGYLSGEGQKFTIYSLPWRYQKREDQLKIGIKYNVRHQLDHKYHDGTMAYYRHVLKRHIVDYYFKKGDCFYVELLGIDGSVLWCHNFDEHKGYYYEAICKYVQNYLTFMIRKRAAHEAIWSWVKTEFPEGYEFSTNEQLDLDQYLVRGLERVVTYSDLDIAKQVFDREFKELVAQYSVTTNQEDRRRQFQLIHDKGDAYLRLPAKYCTKSVFKKIFLTFNFGQIQQFQVLVSSILSLSVFEAEALRKWLYRLSRKADFLAQLKSAEAEFRANHDAKIAELNRNAIKEALPELKVKSIEVVESFIAAMRRYDEHLRFREVQRVLGNETLGKMVNQTYPCVFKPETFKPSYQAMGSTIHALLKSKAVRNPKRLYHHLRQLKPVPQLLEGDFTAEEGKALLSIVQPFSTELQSWEPLLHLSAKVEQKGSPEFLMAGNASVCCMSFGASNANTYAKEKAFGVLNLYYEDRVVGNSVLWMNESQTGRVLVLDNVEIHPNYADRVNPFLKEFLGQIVTHLQARYRCPYVIQGKSYNDFDLFEEEALEGKIEAFNVVGMKGAKAVSGDFYTDARYFKVVRGESLLPTKTQSSEDKVLRLNLTKEGFVLEEVDKSVGSDFDDDLPF